jgi:hypothetical protein
MAGGEIADEIRRIVRNQLSECERAIKHENQSRARRELDDAVRKLKRLADQIG